MPVDTTKLLADAQTLAQAVIDQDASKTKADASAAQAAADQADENAKAADAVAKAKSLKDDIDALVGAPAAGG